VTAAVEIRAVVFDMGGVLVELGPLTDILGPEPSLTDDEFWARWLASPAVRNFEMGRSGLDEFGRRLVDELGIDATADEMVARFAAWPKGLFAGAAELVRALDGRATTAVLSNTNPLHWETQVDAAVMQGLFDRRFLSFELGLAKPDAAMFERVVDDLAIEPAAVLFLDDNQVNIDGATAVGLTAQRVRGVAEARMALARYDLL
jgi:putative hydrolase of the HAD superfamily